MIRLAVRCRPELAERVLAELVELAPGGVEEERGRRLRRVRDLRAAGRDPGAPRPRGRGRRRAGRDQLDRDPRRLGRPLAGLPRPGRDRRRADRRPALVGDDVRRADPGTPGREAEEVAGIDVVIDPGQAFGTGAHATTRLCLELLLELADAGEASGPLADLGTGSGVLGDRRREARLGARRRRCDSEPASIEAAAENAAANGVELELERRQPARAAAADGADRGREPDRAAARGGRGADSTARRRPWSARACW